jgi:3-oxoacyl-[acyl-carrier protein] reductase
LEKRHVRSDGSMVLVNNAGVYSFGPLESVSETEFHRPYSRNVLGLLATQEAVELFGENGGSIINIGTAGTRNLGPAMVLYLSTKGSIDIITQVLAKELGPKKIRVNSINPGGTETEGAHALGVMGSEFEKHLISQTPLGRFGQPEDITPVAVQID